jgi:thioredoxin reductase (NADPH)
MKDIHTRNVMKDTKVHDLIIIGAGPAALSAAIYTCREDIDTLLIEKSIVGGQAATTDWVDNYPGFPDGIAGNELADKLRKQAERFGAKFAFAEVSDVVRENEFIKLTTDAGDYLAKSVLIATGTSHKKLHIPNEEEYTSRGVHYCATCDGAFYRDKDIVVVGGGNSAVQEAIFLTRFAKHVDLLVRSEIKASDVLQHELAKQKSITVHSHVSTDEIVVSDNRVTGARITDKVTGEQKDVMGDGVFIFVGLLPNTSFLKDAAIALDDVGFVKADAASLETNIKGVFVAGDVRSGATMQIASAVGEGATAALRVRSYLEGKNHDA